MKKLILMRHAKSCWNQPWQDDHDRPLAERGLRDAPIMALRLANRDIHPDLLLSSSATRAIQTSEFVAHALRLSPEKIEVNKNLYHASPELLLKCIRKQKNSIQTLILIGHNPGLTEVTNLLGVRLDNLPTSGQIAFELCSDYWAEFSKETVKFWFIDFPKKII
jgi:phosphohistidine phosphatase